MISLLYFSELTYGKIRYFEANRCINTKQVRQYNQDLITCDEIVSFDCGLFDMREIASLEEILSSGTEQILAVIMRPDPKPNSDIQKQEGFVFCGYDLVEDFSAISAITNCGGSFQSICYESLTEYGLIATYQEAVSTQLALKEEAPNENHADCEIVEIWRKLI